MNATQQEVVATEIDSDNVPTSNETNSHRTTTALDLWTLLHELSHNALHAHAEWDFFRLLRERHHEILPSRRLLVLLHHESSQYFYVPSYLATELPVLSYQDTALRDLLQTKRSWLRLAHDAGEAEAESLSPLEQRIFERRFVSELAVPMISAERILGILHFSSPELGAFGPREQLAAEHVAALAALLLTRVEHSERSNRLQDDLQAWRKRAGRVFRLVKIPLAVMHGHDHIIYDANPAFAKVTGYTTADLHGMHFHQLFRASERAEVLVVLRKLEHTLRVGLEQSYVLRKSGKVIAQGLSLHRLDERRNLVMVMLHDPHARDSARHATGHAGKRLLAFMRRYGAKELVAFEQAALQHAAKHCRAQYAALYYLPDPASERLVLKAGMQFTPRTILPLTPPWLSGMEQTAVQNFLQAQRGLEILRVLQDPRMSPWRPFAEKLGYTTVAVAPLVHEKKIIGALCLFFAEDKKLREQDEILLRGLASLLEGATHHDQIAQNARRLELERDLGRRIHEVLAQALSAKTLLEQLTLVLAQAIPFDMVRVALFPAQTSAAEQAKDFILIAKNLAESCSGCVWSPLSATAEWGWYMQEENSFALSAGFAPTQPRLEEIKFHAESNFPLLVQGRYLGTLSLFARHAGAFMPAQQNFLRETCGQIALALNNAQLLEEQRLQQIELHAYRAMTNSAATAGEDRFVDALLLAAQTHLGAHSHGLKILATPYRFFARHLAAGPQLLAPELLAFTEQPHIAIPNLQRPHGHEALFAPIEDAAQGAAAQEAAAPQGALLLQPIWVNNEAVAALMFYWEAPQKFSRAQLEIARFAATHLAVFFTQQAAAANVLADSIQVSKANKELRAAVLSAAQALRVPLLGLTGVVEHLKPQAHETEDLARVRQYAQRLRGLTHNLLTLVETTPREQNFELVHAATLVQQALTHWAEALTQQRVRVAMPEQWPFVWCDPVRLAQVFTHLLEHGLRAVHAEAESALTLRWEDKHTHWLFALHYSGPGIAEADLARFFEVEVAGDSNKNENDLTLQVLKHLVEKQGGAIWVESTLGEGATLCFTLPQKRNGE